MNDASLTNPEIDFNEMREYFDQKLTAHGATPVGVDWNSTTSQEARFEQLVKVINPSQPFTIIDYGCGYGALAPYLARRGYSFEYTGYDLLESMVVSAREIFKDQPNIHFTAEESGLPVADYTVASGIFNKIFAGDEDTWLEYIKQTLTQMNALSRKGIAFNMLTKYSDAGLMRPDLYYADPCVMFDFCKTHFSRNVALLHDYEYYDFTILVRKA